MVSSLSASGDRPSAFQTAAAGASAAEKRFDGAAIDIAAAGAASGTLGPATRLDLSRSAIDLMTARFDVEANLAVMKRADAMQKKLLDVTA